MRRALAMSLALGTGGCAGGASITTTILPPHRLEAPICPSAVLVHDSPEEVPPGGRLMARFRIAGAGAKRTSDRLRQRLRVEAAKLGATRVLAAEMVTPSMMERLALQLAEGVPMDERVRQRREALAKPETAERAPSVGPVDPSFYGRGLAYAIFLPDDTLRIPLECPGGQGR